MNEKDDFTILDKICNNEELTEEERKATDEWIAAEEQLHEQQAIDREIWIAVQSYAGMNFEYAKNALWYGKPGKENVMVSYAVQNDLNEIPIQGKVKFVSDKKLAELWNYENTFESEILDSPTWLEIAVICNKMILTTKDFHHRFLEGVTIIDDTEDVKIAGFFMGS